MRVPKGKRSEPEPPPWTPLYAVTKTYFLPAYKFEAARRLVAAGATVAAMPEPLRDEFRAALRTWDPDWRTLGKSLGTRPNERYWLDEHPLFFRDAIADVEVEVCQVANGSWGCLPYASDEYWSFEAVLYAVGTLLVARVSKFHDILDQRDATDFWFESTNDGREWTRGSAAPDLTGAVELSRCTD